MKQVEVQIMGQSYRLACPEEGDTRLLAAVERVDAAMCRIRDAGKVRARDRIAVLAALNLAFDLTDQAPPAPTSNSASVSTVPGSPQAPVAGSEQPLVSLLERLDEALGDDGRLI